MSNFSCGVMNCGKGKCVHKVIEMTCPCCDQALIMTTPTGYIFCRENVCEFELDPIDEKCDCAAIHSEDEVEINRCFRCGGLLWKIRK